MASEKNNSNKITTLAAKTLREAHPEEYEAAKVAAAQSLGVEYKRRKTQAERDRETLAALLQSNPELRAELVEEIAAEVRTETASSS